ncbi:MAG: hypothetical protein KME06_07870 [Kastovskya adunca ATA6-11-RM4]|jgi:hypothetical protein|nr:hypothetical protein [Kastovskya adunca ATA6-11-RM4]
MNRVGYFLPCSPAPVRLSVRLSAHAEVSRRSLLPYSPTFLPHPPNLFLPDSGLRTQDFFSHKFRQTLSGSRYSGFISTTERDSGKAILVITAADQEPLLSTAPLNPLI